MPKYFDRSPQEVDPLSWFTGPRLPMVLAGGVALQAVAITLLYLDNWSNIALQFVSIPFFFAAAWATVIATQPHRPQFGPLQAAIGLGFGAAGVVVSAIGTYGGSIPVEQWWPTIALGVTLASFSPYSSARRMISYSVPTIVFTGIVSGIVFLPTESFWAPGATIVIASSPVIIAAVGGTMFSYAVVRKTDSYLAIGAEDPVPAGPGFSAAESGGVARMSARVAPFLSAVAEAGVITDADRGLAAQLARHLRTELVDAANRSWLDDVALESGMKVSDPSRSAERLNESQRAALRGLLVAALESPVVRKESLLIELRAQPDGSTAVALSIDVDLPEGRRLMLLAPYYLTLKTTVQNLSWDDGRILKLEFKVPAAD